MAGELLIIESGTLPAESGMIRAIAQESGWCCEQAGWESFEPQSLRRCAARLIVVVADTDSSRALNLLRWLCANPVASPSFAILPADSSAELLRAASEAATDFIVSPIHKNELRFRIRRILGTPGQDVESVERRLNEELGLAQIIGADPAFARVIEKIPPIAAADIPVLLTGETGTGKELCARAIHHLSRRQGAPFIPVECGAFPEQLVENELFGHVRGAFTDAHADQKGLVAMAERGTLFLDEVDTLSVGVQAKLLRFLQEHTYRALGGEKFCRADVRMIAATNRDIEACVREKVIRADLYYRLNVLRLHLPALRDRRADIPVLARHFLEAFCQSAGLPHKFFSAGALTLLSQHNWPGNVRELQNIIERGAALAKGPTLDAADIHFDPLRAKQGNSSAAVLPEGMTLEQWEDEIIREALRRAQGNKSQAARMLGLSRNALRYLLSKIGIEDEPEKDQEA